MASRADHSLRGILTGFAAIIALAIVVVVGTEYFITAHDYESERIQATSDSAAATLSRMIYRAPDTWLFQESRVTELLSEFSVARVGARRARHVRVLDNDGNTLFELGPRPSAPTLMRESLLTDGFENVGRVQITESIAHLWQRTMIATLIGAILAIAMAVVLRSLPLRALTKREDELVAANAAAQSSARDAVTAKTHLSEAIEAMNDAFVLYDSADRLELSNTKFREFYAPLAEFVQIGTSHEDFLRAGLERHLFPEAIGREDAWLAARIADHREPSGSEYELKVGQRWLRISERRTQTGGIVAVHSDMTASKLAELALRASEEQLRLVTDAMPALIAYIDSRLRFRFANKLFEEWFKRPREDFIGRTLKDILSEEHYATVQPLVQAALAGEDVASELTVVYPDGVKRQVNANYKPHFDEGGVVRGYFVLIQDITEKRETQQQLLQVQKQEAVGQIAGGIAHDFNNLLGVILGNLELLSDHWEETGHPPSPFIKTAMRATARGSELTQRLLAFSRKQTLLPKATDVNELVSGMTELLHRAIIESITIETELADDLPPAMVDPGQLENAILNLAINARDAMPTGGKLTIKSAVARIDDDQGRSPQNQVAPGTYVTVAVSDTGTGMAPDVQARAFDPFFTTKDVGQGSGLGLSMILGFAKQSGGHADIESEIGQGTTIMVYLPLAHGLRVAEPGQRDESKPPKGKEVVLVVEDNPEVNDVAVSLLKSLGYRILEARDGPTALKILERRPDVDLLFTDLVMPGGMTGVQLANEVRQRRRGVKVLFTSGHSDDVEFGALWKGRDTHFIGKPYNKRSLAKKVRAVIDGREM